MSTGTGAGVDEQVHAGGSLAPVAALLAEDPAVLEVSGRANAVLAVPEPARAFVIAGLVERSRRRPFLVAVPTVNDAEALAADLVAYLGATAVEYLPAWETLPFERVSPAIDTMATRLRVMWRLRTGDPGLRVVVCPARSLVQRLGPHVEEVEPLEVRPGDRLDLDDLVEQLVEIGYRREYQVEHQGEFAVRGSIIDVYPAGTDSPVRIDLWGDEVERLSEFGVGDQRSTDDLALARIWPCRELLPTEEVRARAARLLVEQPWGAEQWDRLAEGQTFDGMESWLPWLVEGEHLLVDLLGPEARVLLVEPRRLRDRIGDLLGEEADLARTLAGTWGIVGEEGAVPRLHLEMDRILARTDLPTWNVTMAPESPDVVSVAASGWPPAVGDATALVARLRQAVAEGYRVVVTADGEGSATRLDKILVEHGIGVSRAGAGDPGLVSPGTHLVVTPLQRGFIAPTVRLAVLTESDLVGRRRTHRTARVRKRDAVRFFEELKEGDHVVHHHHGVARFEGMVKRAIGGVERDYLLLVYRGGDKLYVPSDQIDAVRPYTGGETPTLSKMGGSDFARTKAKVRSEVAKIAQELVVLYQKRISTPGHPFAPDTPWQSEMEAAFPFQETHDQLTAIADVKADMESERPMDRLVVGDVGFGKTEVAVRAAFKAIQDGKQVAVLVPTTLLARQHELTFAERMAGYPIRIESLSRFLTAAEARKVAAGLESGEVDLVVGTHRLLSGDVKFKNLGLLVIDEEQRFGVSHKEAIKQFKTNVDVLTLTATPIPRTLEMSLTGIRDLSLLQTPPAARQPILTYVGEYDQRAVAEAIRRELLREGQVFFVHNRVRDIDRVASELRELVPEARVAVAHGQMDEGTLEQVVVDFWDGNFDVLVCTTIIESGIDIPTVNTLVVDRADLLGLGQLHQIRGRVGRAGMRAYAYLFFPPDRELTEEAYERLRTISESTELGSGFRIAMRDLEIRGAGNLLGTGQSGHIAAVGYDLYCQMVQEAIAELNGEEPSEPAEIKLELPLAAYLPTDYVEREDVRLDIYRRLAAVAGPGDVDDIEAEWQDRFGPVPEAAAALLDVARLRAECVRTGVTEVTVTKGSGFGGPAYLARISPLPLPQSKQMRLTRLYKGSVYKPDGASGQPQVQIGVKGGRGLPVELVGVLRELVPLPGEESATAATAVVSSGRGTPGGRGVRA